MRPIFILYMCLIPIIAAIINSGNKTGYIDPRLISYIDDFESYGRVYISPDFKMPVITITIEPVDAVNFNMDFRVAAVCSISISGVNHIIIGDYLWTMYDDVTKEQVIFHELGHCVLYRPHLSTYRSNTLPVSLMHPYLTLTPEEFLKEQDYYIKELFSDGIGSLKDYLLGN